MNFAVRYDGATPHPIDPYQIPELPHDGFVWISLQDPERAEIDRLRTTLALHPLAIADALTPGQEAVADPMGDNVFVQVPTIVEQDRMLLFGQVSVFLNERAVLSIGLGPAGHHDDLRREIEAVPDLAPMGVDFILYGLLNQAAKSFVTLTSALEQAIEALEGSVPTGDFDRRRVAELLELRKRVKQVERVLEPMEEMAEKLAAGHLPHLKPELNLYFRDIAGRVRRARAACARMRDGLALAFEYTVLLEQQRTGDVTRQLAAWAGILAVQTVIVGVYGMNFAHMPELGWRYGYAAVLLAMLASSLLLYARFRKLGWLRGQA